MRLYPETAATQLEFNKIKAADIIERFMQANAYEFLKKNF